MGRAETLTSHLKRYDANLYASSQPTGAIWVLRKNRSRPHEPHFIFALTDDWTVHGTPREWGIEPVMNRIRAIDLWRDDQIVERVLAENDKAIEASNRERRNSVESYLYEFRRQFAKATNDVNTSLLPKTDARRKGDLKYGR